MTNTIYVVGALLLAFASGYVFKTPASRMTAFGVSIFWPFIPCLVVAWLCMKAGEWIAEKRAKAVGAKIKTPAEFGDALADAYIQANARKDKDSK